LSRPESLSAESLSAASCEGCNLASKELNAMRNEIFQKNFVVYSIDKAHVLIPWSIDFRLVCHQDAILPKWLPNHVSLIVTTATLAPGHGYDSLVCSALSL
jgi:hypothetical protein